MAYYDGTKLLSLKDANGQKPEVYFCVGNRTAGKTTYFNRWLVKKFKRDGEKFVLLYRTITEIKDVERSFFQDISGLFFPADEMTAKPILNGHAKELFLNGDSCGFAIPLNSSNTIKKNSHFFNHVSRIFFDEFQSETNTYVPRELTKFKSIHTSIARGQGKQVRYVPVILCSNAVSLLNPYFVDAGISTKLQLDTKFLRGDGYVVEQCYNESAGEAQRASAFNRAFSGGDYLDYSAENVYLNDSMTFIDKPVGRGTYLCTVKYKGKNFGILKYPEAGYIYVSRKADLSFMNKISLTLEDHSINYVMLKEYSWMIADFRFFFNNGCFRFADLQCKEAAMTMLAY